MPLCSTGRSRRRATRFCLTGHLWDTLTTQHWGGREMAAEAIDLDRYVDILELFPAESL